MSYPWYPGDRWVPLPNDQVIGHGPARMGMFGQIVTLCGVIAIVLPPIALVLELFPGVGFPVALVYAPTFVLGGIILFVVGTVLRVYTTY